MIQDRDWETGSTLVAFEVRGAGKAEDANLLCDVRLKLRGAGGREVEKDVTYIVGTDPVLTVFRKVF